MVVVVGHAESSRNSASGDAAHRGPRLAPVLGLTDLLLLEILRLGHGHLPLFAPTTPQHLPRRLAEWMRAVLHSHRGIQPAHERLLTEFACEMVRARFLVQAQDLMYAVRRALLSDKLLLASPWRKFYEMHLLPLVQECVRNAFDGGSLKLQPLFSNIEN